MHSRTYASLTLLAVVIVFALAGCATQTESHSGDHSHVTSTDAPATVQLPDGVTDVSEPVKGYHARLVVKGLSCPLCAHNIDKQLAAIPGVKAVAVDLGAGTADLEFQIDGCVSYDQLLQAVRDAGFTTERVELLDGKAGA